MHFLQKYHNGQTSMETGSVKILEVLLLTVVLLFGARHTSMFMGASILMVMEYRILAIPFQWIKPKRATRMVIRTVIMLVGIGLTHARMKQARHA